MDENDLQFETRFSTPRNWFPLAAAVAGVVIIAGIIVIMTTDIASSLLPMEDRYFDVLVPLAADGSEALSLRELAQKGDEKALSVDGSVLNRTESPIAGLSAVVEFKDKYTLPAETVTVPVDPPLLEPGETGKFHAEAVGGEHGLGGYSLQFRLPDDGPFVPHIDERSDRSPSPQTP